MPAFFDSAAVKQVYLSECRGTLRLNKLSFTLSLIIYPGYTG